MSVSKVSFGIIRSFDDVVAALQHFQETYNQLFVDDAPANDAQVLVRDPEGNMRQYTIQSGGGCTVTINDAARTITISVP